MALGTGIAPMRAFIEVSGVHYVAGSHRGLSGGSSRLYGVGSRYERLLGVLALKFRGKELP